MVLLFIFLCDQSKLFSLQNTKINNEISSKLNRHKSYIEEKERIKSSYKEHSKENNIKVKYLPRVIS